MYIPRIRRDKNREFMKRGDSISLPENCAGSVNGICDLPDSILCHILSFLPTENAVATHILSQRWKFLWTMTNNLDFSCPYSKINQYVRFVNRVLLFHKAGYLNRLSLTWLDRCIPYHVNTWISVAVLRNVHELFVHVPNPKLSILVQRSMFNCESLRSLELNCIICISDEVVVSLPRLETLRLISISLQSEETLCKLLGGCPVLKYLFIKIDDHGTMESCRLDIDNDIKFRCIISSDSLRRLELSTCVLSISVQLDAPLLEYMRLDDISSICIHQSPVFLVEASIDLVSLGPVFEDQNYFNSVAKAFRDFDCVKTLTLSPQVIRALRRATIEMKTRFNNLTRLEVKSVWKWRVWKWSSLQEFLTLADCLEVLTLNTVRGGSRNLRIRDCDYAGKDHIGSKSDLVPKCLSNSLRTVSIDDYDDNEDALAMVGYILKHGSVLELMEIRLLYVDIKTNYKVVKEISKLPRKSPVCKVEFRDNL